MFHFIFTTLWRLLSIRHGSCLRHGQRYGGGVIIGPTRPQAKAKAKLFCFFLFLLVIFPLCAGTYACLFNAWPSHVNQFDFHCSASICQSNSKLLSLINSLLAIMNLESEIISTRNGHKKMAKLLRLLDVLQLHLRKTQRIPTSHRDSPASLKANCGRVPVHDLGSDQPAHIALQQHSASILSGRTHLFVPAWYHNRDWLEYSVKATTAFYSCCRRLLATAELVLASTGLRRWKLLWVWLSVMGKMQRREIIITTMQNVELLSLDLSKVAQLSLEIHQFMAIIVWDFFHHSLFFFTFIFFLCY